MQYTVVNLPVSFLQCYQVSGVTNNIDFLVDTAKHPGFLHEQPTTGFFDQHLRNILNHLSTKSKIRNHQGNLTDHSVMALAGLCEYMKEQGGASTQSVENSTQSPWASSSGDWRGFGSVRRTVDILPGGQLAGTEPDKESICIESTGEGKFMFHSPHVMNQQHTPKPIQVNFKSVSAVPMAAGRVRESGEAVWKMSMEINGRLKTGTIAVYKTATQRTVADGNAVTINVRLISVLIFYFKCSVAGR